MNNNIYQLILIDEKTGQPQKVETVYNHLDMNSTLQRTLYLSTINNLTPNTEIVDRGEEGGRFIIDLNKNNPPITAITADVFEPEEEDKTSKKRSKKTDVVSEI